MSKKETPPASVKIIKGPQGTIPLAGQIPTSKNTPPPPKELKKK